MPVPENPLDFGFKEKTVTMPNGSTWHIRELSVGENDECADLARKPDQTIDARAMMRFILARSVVEPKVSIDDLMKLPNRAYLVLADAANELNAPEDDESEPGEG